MSIIRITLSILLTLLILLAGAWGIFQYSKSRTSQLFGEIIHRVNTEEKIIALTFDDGPTALWSEIAHILENADTRATFYLIGEQIEKEKELAKQIVAAGHEVGNHSYSHPRFLFISYDKVAEEIERTNTLLREIGYKGEITFRPPHGKKLWALPLYLSTHGIKTITWDIEPETYLPQDADAHTIANYVTERVRPGSIILLHPWHKNSTAVREALPLIITTLQQEGYRFVTVSELLTSS